MSKNIRWFIWKVSYTFTSKLLQKISKRCIFAPCKNSKRCKIWKFRNRKKVRMTSLWSALRADHVSTYLPPSRKGYGKGLCLHFCHNNLLVNMLQLWRQTICLHNCRFFPGFQCRLCRMVVTIADIQMDEYITWKWSFSHEVVIILWPKQLVLVWKRW